MHSKKNNFGLLLVSVLAVSVLAVGTVSARGGLDDTSSSGSSSSGSGSSGSSSGSSGSVTVASTDPPETEHATETESATTGNVDDLRDRAKTELNTERQHKKPASTVVKRQKACQAREANLNNKIANYNKQAKRHLAAYDAAFAKLQAYQAEKNLPADQYEALVATAKLKQTAATEAVNALEDVSIKIDCTSEDPAAAVATVKAAVANAKKALKEYRTAVKNVLVELMTSKSDESSTDSEAAKPAETNTQETN